MSSHRAAPIASIFGVTHRSPLNFSDFNLGTACPVPVHVLCATALDVDLVFEYVQTYTALLDAAVGTTIEVPLAAPGRGAIYASHCSGQLAELLSA
eukprot:COSAG02_NODE_1270_length_13529_cov_44.209680_7_plen_96_part_00